MKVKAIIDEDFTNYKKACMFIGLGTCNWKCCIEANIPITICQNSELAKQKDIEISVDEIFHRYTSNPITSAICIGGLEAVTKWQDIVNLIAYFRNNNCNDTFVIYTGYYADEIRPEIEQIKQYGNIVIKFGRYKPNNKPHYDDVLGINLISDNQYGKVIC